MNVKTFEVLAAVTYPSFDLNTYNKEYNNLLKQDGSPLYNRAFNGNYAPGSTFKPAVALAGLQEGEISRYTTIYTVLLRLRALSPNRATSSSTKRDTVSASPE